MNISRGWIVAGILTVGILLRLAFWLSCPPLWGDEAMLAVSFAELPFSWLSGLRYNQTAPIGFLALSWLVVHVLGDGELVLRLVPLLAGIAALPVFWRLADRLLGWPWSPVALAVFAVSASGVYYSGEAKPYALDILAACVLLLTALRAGEGEVSREGAGWIAVGAVLFSQASVFVLLAGALWLALRGASVRRPALTWLAVALVAAWGYHATMRGSTASLMDDFWAGAFLGASLDPEAYLRGLAGLFDRVLGSPWPAVVGPVALWGLIRSRDPRLLLLVGPLVLVAAASLFGAYPFSTLRPGMRNGRLLVFLLPGIVLVVTIGLRHAGRVRWPLTALLLVLVGFRGVQTTLDAGSVFSRTDVPSVVATVARDPDTLVVPPHMVPAFRYYLDRSEVQVLLLPSTPDVDGSSLESGWVYTDWANRTGLSVFLHRFCRDPCEVTVQGEEVLLRLRAPPRGPR